MEEFQQQGPQSAPSIPEAPAMDFMTAVKTCFSKYATFSGRATRAEYWWWTLAMVIVSVAASFINPIVSWVVALATFIPSLAVGWRRLHDIGRAGGWYFISFIPLVGWLLLLYWEVKPSEPCDNRFGPYLG
jgi:uncharacterized membrane protein YhaH (DUF805 family)